MDNSKLEQLKIDRESGAQNASRIWWVLIPVLLLLAGAAGWFVLKPEAAVEVRTTVATTNDSRTGGTVLNASGYVNARRQATVSSKVTGKVVEVLIEEGMHVEQGQVLARLDDTNLSASLELAEAQLASSKAGLRETTALLDEARANLRRIRNLVERKLASEAELDRARAQAESLEAELGRKRADVTVADKALEVWRRQLEDTIIRAPFSGVVVAKNAQPGEMISPVSAGGGFTRTGIGTIVDMDSLEIEIDVNEAYINRVSEGQPVVATLDAYPDWPIPGYVIAIIPTADRQRATVEVRVGFDELDPRILPDMGVKVAFRDAGAGQPGRRLVVVPESAVRKSDGRDIVFVVSGDTVERRAVSVADTVNGQARIEAGLSGGETVVSEGPADLADGANIRMKEE